MSIQAYCKFCNNQTTVEPVPDSRLGICGSCRKTGRLIGPTMAMDAILDYLHTEEDEMRFLVIEGDHIGWTITGSISRGFCGDDMHSPTGGCGAGAVYAKHVVPIGPTEEDRKRYYDALNGLRNALALHQTNDAPPPHGKKCPQCENLERTIEALEAHKRWFN